MRGYRAKLIRFLAYGPKRTRQEHVTNDPAHREYKGIKHVTKRKGNTIQIVNSGQRAVYLAFKKRYKAWCRDGRMMQSG